MSPQADLPGIPAKPRHRRAPAWKFQFWFLLIVASVLVGAKRTRRTLEISIGARTLRFEIAGPAKPREVRGLFPPLPRPDRAFLAQDLLRSVRARLSQEQIAAMARTHTQNPVGRGLGDA